MDEYEWIGPASAPPRGTEPGVTPPAGPPLGLLKSARIGAVSGLRRVTCVAGPVAILTLIPGLVLGAVGLGAGRGWPIAPGFIVPPTLAVPIVFFLACGTLGLMIGGPLGLLLALLRRARPGSLTARAWDAANRPIFRRSAPSSADRPAKRRGPPWRWLIGLPTAVALLVIAVGLGAGVYLGKVVDRRLARAISEADRDDPNWRFDDLLDHREAIPDDANSALVVSEVVDSLPENWPNSPPSSPGGPTGPPTAVFQAINRMPTTPHNLRLDDATVALIRGELDRHKGAVQVARTVADFDRGRHEFEVGPTIYDTLLPDTQASRSVARLMAADSAIRAQDGDIDGALDSCRAIIAVGRSIGDEPFLISQLMRKAIDAVALNAIHRALGQGEPTDEALASLQSLLGDEGDQPFFVTGIRGERAMLDELLRRIRTGELPLEDFRPDTPTALIGTRRGVVFSWGKLSFDNQRALALEWLNEAVAIAHQPARLRPPLWDAWQAEIVREKQKRFFAYTSAFPVFMMPAVAAFETEASRHQAGFGAMTILIAAERHRRKLGSWPKSIATIDPAFLPNARNDPYTDAPYHLARRVGRYLIYSVGPNQFDDGGRPSDNPSRKSPGPDDIIAEAWDLGKRGHDPPQPADDFSARSIRVAAQ